MTKKEYLMRAHRIDGLINGDLSELNRLKSLVMSLASFNTKDAVMHSRDSSAPFTLIIEKIVDLEKKINSEVNAYIDIKKDIRRAADSLSDDAERALIIYRYLGFLSFEEIAEQMNYSVRQIFRIHGKALEHIDIPECSE